jgi:hypothetical protein
MLALAILILFDFLTNGDMGLSLFIKTLYSVTISAMAVPAIQRNKKPIRPNNITAIFPAVFIFFLQALRRLFSCYYPNKNRLICQEVGDYNRTINKTTAPKGGGLLTAPIKREVFNLFYQLLVNRNRLSVGR